MKARNCNWFYLTVLLEALASVSVKIGIWVGNNSDGDFANLQIAPQD
jgi:hypothetical protein